MTKELLSEVRDELESRSTKTSISELEQRGMRQVRVIRSSQILQLIEDAVDRALHERGLDVESEDRTEVVESSKQILKEMVQQPPPDHEMLQELCRRMEHAESEVSNLRSEVAERERELQESKSQAAELNAQLQMIHKRAATAAPEALLDELMALRTDIRTQQPMMAAPVQPTADPAASQALNDQIASLGKQLGQEIERIGRKVGVSSAEEVEIGDFSGLFEANGPELESNLDTIATEEHKGADVADALARMKSLKKKS